MSSDYPHNVIVILSVKSGAKCESCKTSKLGRCSHVLALVLYIVDYVDKNGSRVTKLCTSSDCSWNKGKKCRKNPQHLSSAVHPTKRKVSARKVIDFHLRPQLYRQVKTTDINKFVINLQSNGQAIGETPMWTTQLQIHYDDCSLSEISIIDL